MNTLEREIAKNTAKRNVMMGYAQDLCKNGLMDMAELERLYHRITDKYNAIERILNEQK